MNKLVAINMLREVLLGERTKKLPQNSVQRTKTLQKAAPTNKPSPAAEPAQVAQAPTDAPIAASNQSPLTPVGTPLTNNASYISDNKDKAGPLSRGYETIKDEDPDKGDWNMSNINVAPLPHIR